MRIITFTCAHLILSAAFANVAFAADELNQIESSKISERISGPRIYLGLGIDNVSERRSTDISPYGLIEAASSVLHDPTGLRFRVSADVSEVGVWAGAGISSEYVFEQNPFYIEASILAGAYTDFGKLDLDHVLEFRSQIAIGYHFENNYDLAIGYAHKSNASIGDSNPGAESLYIRLGRGF